MAGGNFPGLSNEKQLYPSDYSETTVFSVLSVLRPLEFFVPVEFSGGGMWGGPSPPEKSFEASQLSVFHQIW